MARVIGPQRGAPKAPRSPRASQYHVLVMREPVTGEARAR